MRVRRNDCSFAARAMVVFLGLAGQPCRAAQLRTETIKAFDAYVEAREAGMDRDTARGAFLSLDKLPAESKARSNAQLKEGDVLIRNTREEDSRSAVSVPGGLIHDWTGIVFVPNASLQQTLALLQDYDHDGWYYRPDVVKSKLLGRTADGFHVFLRLRKRYVLTTVFDTEYDVRYAVLDQTHARSRSYSTRIAEVENPDQPGERDEPPGEDHGFLWRLYSYWLFHQADGGTYIQCEAISLTRDVPMGLGWMIKPLIEKIPLESLRFTLTATRDALLKTNPGPEAQDAKSTSVSPGK